MIDESLGFIVSSLPWWLAAPILQLTVLTVGMALDETYVNRTTVLTGAIATHVHIFVAGDAGILVSVYADLGLIIGAYGLYAYVIDGYVSGWFRILAFFVYSPLSVFLVILTAGPTLFGIEPLFVPALALAGYGNVQLREYLRPDDPYYFGPESQAEFEAVIEAETTAGASAETAASGGATATAGAATAETGSETPADTHATGEAPSAGAATPNGAGPAGDPASQPAAETANGSQATTTDSVDDSADFDRPDAEPAAAADSSERGILPKFMRRL
ncbi:hypothetical protein [Haloterrigena alkaliphila]|uniref:hypothetical protein n=1 Tax=Haloterrigena alkaliphila TaxID=2816475 RepID=UPI001CFFB492|nr:hypothetical protein [Haloterrigena alkaliphila]UHQ95299.1 hypothetical protein J0X25_20745 [Haloterrigena alkaliphila]